MKSRPPRPARALHGFTPPAPLVARLFPPLIAVLAVALSACGTRGIKLPEGPGEPFPGYEQAFAEATVACRDIRTLTAEARVAGSVDGGKVRGRVIMGFERPGRMRLEAVAPMGAPVFILAADGGTATLLMPRAGEVLRGEPTDRVLEALIGLSLNADDLLAILAGCVAPDPKAVAGRQFVGGWLRAELEGGSAAYLRQEGGAWRVRAGVRPSLRIEYELGQARSVEVVRLQAPGNGGAGASLRVALAQVEANASIPADAFRVVVPAGAVSITLNELKQSGPLGERR